MLSARSKSFAEEPRGALKKQNPPIRISFALIQVIVKLLQLSERRLRYGTVWCMQPPVFLCLCSSMRSCTSLAQPQPDRRWKTYFPFNSLPVHPSVKFQCSHKQGTRPILLQKKGQKKESRQLTKNVLSLPLQVHAGNLHPQSRSSVETFSPWDTLTRSSHLQELVHLIPSL